MTVVETYRLADGSDYTSRAKALQAGLRRVYLTSDGHTFQFKKDALAHEAGDGKTALVMQVLNEHFSGGGHETKGTITRFMTLLQTGNYAENIEVIAQAMQMLASDITPELLADTIDEEEVDA